MADWPAAAFVTAAACVGGAAAACLAARLVVARRTLTRRGLAPTAAVVCLAVAAGGVAVAAEGGRRHPPVSVDWPVDAAGSAPIVVVGAGDSLWRIASRVLDRPTTAQVAAAWPRWWHTNRRVIGANPNLIHPGQRLRAPGRPSRRPS